MGTAACRKALNGLDYPVSRWKGRQWIWEEDMTVSYCKKGHVTTNRNHKQIVFANRLECQFSASQHDQVYASDVTYVWI